MNFKVFSVFCLLLLSLFISQLRALTTLKGEDLKVGQIHLIEEAGSEGGAHIFPHEFDSFLYEPLFSSAKGALVQVGTILQIPNPAVGSISQIFLLNDDAAVTQFNKTILSLVQTLGKISPIYSIQRYQFISLLLHGQILSPDELSSISKEKTPLEKIAKINSAKLAAPSLSEELQNILKELYDNFELSHGSVSGVREELKAAWLQQLKKDERHPYYFWGSDLAWTQFQNMIRSHKIHSVTGSFTGEQTIRSMALALQKTHDQVSWINLSSLPEEIFLLEPKLDFSEHRSKMIENIKLLPLNTNAKIMFSLPSNCIRETSLQAPSHDLARIYLSLNWAQFSQISLLPPSDSFNALKDFSKSLIKKAGSTLSLLQSES